MKKNLKYLAVFVLGGFVFLGLNRAIGYFSLQKKSASIQSVDQEDQSISKSRDNSIDLHPLNKRRDDLRKLFQKMHRPQQTDDSDSLASQFQQMRQQMLQMIQDQTGGIDFQVNPIDNDSNLIQSEDKQNYYWELALDQIDENSIKIDVKDGLLSISGQSKIEEENNNQGSFSRSTVISNFHKSFPVPENTDVSKLKIEKKDKKIQIVLPKRA